MKKNQTSEVLNYLKTHKKGITSIQAFEKFGATRLSAIIFNLRQKGYGIDSVAVESTNRYGDKVLYSRYILSYDKDLEVSNG